MLPLHIAEKRHKMVNPDEDKLNKMFCTDVRQNGTSLFFHTAVRFRSIPVSLFGLNILALTTLKMLN